MPSTFRVPEDLHRTIRNIRIDLEREYEVKTPSLQDFANVALERLLTEWENPRQREEILSQLLTRRQNARMRMGPQPKSSRKSSNN